MLRYRHWRRGEARSSQTPQQHQKQQMRASPRRLRARMKEVMGLARVIRNADIAILPLVTFVSIQFKVSELILQAVASTDPASYFSTR